MQYSSIYKNGKPQYFFLAADNQKERAFIQPYFFVTTLEHPRKGRIIELNRLFSDPPIWIGRQVHGYGYSSSADVYGELINIIKTLYKNRLSDDAIKELNAINTHDDNITLSDSLLDELKALNNEYIEKKYN